MSDTSVTAKEIRTLNNAKNESGHVEVPEGITAIGNYAFMGSQIESIKLPTTLESIGYCSFSDCVNLKRIEIPEGVIRIEYGAFSGSRNLEFVSFPKSLASLGRDMFSHCNGLRKVIVPIHLAYQVIEDTAHFVTIEISR